MIAVALVAARISAVKVVLNDDTFKRRHSALAEHWRRNESVAKYLTGVCVLGDEER